MPGTAAGQFGVGIAKERLRQREDRVRADAIFAVLGLRWQNPHRADTDGVEQRQSLFLDHVRQRTDQKKLARLGFRQDRHHRRKARILALREGRLDAGARIVEHPNPRSMGG